MPRVPKALFTVTDEDRQRADHQLLEQQRKVDFDTKEFTVEILVHKFESDDLSIPSYQRNFVWNTQKQSKFIESVLLGIPIPFLFGFDNPESGKIEIVDGSQRIRTLTHFLRNELVLQELEKLTFLTDFRYLDLPVPQQRRFRNRTLRMVVLSEHTDLNTRFDLFERINTGSTSLAPSELRKGAFPGPFYDFVCECAGDQDFVALCPISGVVKPRGEHEELVLRFFVYAEHYRKFQHDVARFLNEYIVAKNAGFDRSEKQSAFSEMLSFVKSHFEYGFAKTQNARSTPRVRFEAIAVGVHLALKQRPGLRPHSMEWLNSDEFKRQTTTHASNSAPRLRARIEYVRDCLLGTKA